MNLVDTLPVFTYQQGELVKCNAASIMLRPDRHTVMYFVEHTGAYTGGRYHMFEHAVALCHLGYQVIYLADKEPQCAADFAMYPMMSNMTIIITKWRHFSHRVFPDFFKLNVVATIGGPPISGKLALDAASVYKCPAYLWCFIVPPLANQYRQTHDTAETFWVKYKQSLRRSRYIITNSEINKRYIPQWLGVKPEQVIVCQPSINDMAARPYYGSKKHREIAFLGRITGYKHPELAYRFMERLNCKGLTLHFIGGNYNSPFENEIKALTAENGLKVQFHPVASDDEKFRILSRCSLALYPTEWEDFGMPPMEAGFFGIPIVTYDMPSLREHYGKNIFYADHGDEEQFMELASLTLMTMNQEVDRRIEANRRYVNGHYLMEHMVAEQSQHFRKIEGKHLSIVALDSRVKRILFDTVTDCRQRGAGDVLMSTPTIKALKTSGEAVEIFYACHEPNKMLFNGNPYVDRVITDLSEIEGYDFARVIQLKRKIESTNCVNEGHRVDAIAHFAETKLKDKDITLILGDEENVQAAEWRSQFTRPVIALCPQSDSTYREWCPFKWLQLAEILDANYDVVVFGKYRQQEFDRWHNLTGKTGMRSLCWMLSICDCIVTLDSLALHVAGALNVPCVTIMGLLPPKVRIAYYSSIRVAKLDCPYEGLEYDEHWNKPDHVGYHKRGYSRCIVDIPIAMVLKQIGSFKLRALRVGA